MTKLQKQWTESRNIGIAQGNLDLIVEELSWRIKRNKVSLWKDEDLLRMARRALNCLQKRDVEQEVE